MKNSVSCTIDCYRQTFKIGLLLGNRWGYFFYAILQSNATTDWIMSISELEMLLDTRVFSSNKMKNKFFITDFQSPHRGFICTHLFGKINMNSIKILKPAYVPPNTASCLFSYRNFHDNRPFWYRHADLRATVIINVARH